MEKSELMRKYELVIVVDSKLPDDGKQSVLKEITDLIVKSGGKVINSHVWLDKHKFAFRISKITEGTYYLINFEADSALIGKLRPVLRINERVLRFLFTMARPQAKPEAARR